MKKIKYFLIIFLILLGIYIRFDENDVRSITVYQNNKLMTENASFGDYLIEDSKYLINVPPQLLKNDFITSFSKTNQNVELVCENGTDYVGSGCILKSIDSLQEVKEYTIIVFGDSNGDGLMNVTDLIRTFGHIHNNFKYNEWQIKAMSIEKREQLSSYDLDRLASSLISNKNFKRIDQLKEETSIQFASDRIELDKGESKKVDFEISDNLDVLISWSSEDEEIAVVDSLGTVTALGSGETNINAKLSNGKSFSIAVHVNSIVTGISVSKTSLVLPIGGTEKIKAVVTPSDANDSQFSWISMDDGIATVDEDGNIVGISAGSTQIIVRTTNGIQDEILVTINPNLEVTINSVDITPSDFMVETGKSYQLNAVISPANVKDKTLIWKSSDEKIAQVNSNGLVTGVTPGAALITATSENGIVATANVIVFSSVTGVQLNSYSLELPVSGTYQMEATITPANASISDVSWTSSNSDIAYVTYSGKVVGVSPGTVTITATTFNGLTSKCEVVVYNSVSKVQLSTPKKILAVGENVDLVTTITPNENLLEQVTYNSSDKTIATVDSKGTVTALKPGTVTITATIGGREAITSLIIKDNPSHITLPTSVTLNLNSTLVLEAKITPNQVYDDNITWKSSNDSVVTVDATGKITGLSEGNATITATTANGISATCDVSVIIPVVSIKLNYTSLYLDLKNQNKSLLEAVITPQNASVKKVTWTSSNQNVATVDESGMLTAVAEGETVITARMTNGKSATCQVFVSNNNSDLLINKIYITNSNQSTPDYAKIGDTLTLQIEALEEITAPSITMNGVKLTVNGSGKNYSATYDVTTTSAEGIPPIKISNYQSVATSTSGRTMTGVTVGTIPIIDKSVPTCQFSDVPSSLVGASTTTIRLTCNEKNSSLSGNLTTSNFEVNGLTISKIKSQNITSKQHIYDITITTNNETQKAFIILKENTFQDSVGNFNERVLSGNINVTQSIIDISLNKTELYMQKNETEQLKITSSSGNINNDNVTWTSNNSAVATVDNTGVVTLISEGTAVITATTTNGLKDTCVVNSYNVPKITITSNDDKILLAGSTVQYTVTTSTSVGIKSFNQDKIHIYTQSPIDYSLIKYDKFSVIQSGNSYKISVVVPEEISQLGLFRLVIDEGAIIDNLDKSNESTLRDDYIVSLNLNAAASYSVDDQYKKSTASIAMAVGVDNSFYTKSFDYFVNNSLEKSNSTSNAHIVYKGLKNGNTYDVKIKVTLYKDRPIYNKDESTYSGSSSGTKLIKNTITEKLSNDTVSGYINKKITIPKSKTNKKLTIDTIDVSEKDSSTGSGFRTGDSIYIMANGKNVLIDTGNSKSDSADNKAGFAKRIATRIKAKNNNICNIDYLILTHTDMDHVGGFNQLINNEGCAIKNLVVSNNHYNKYDGAIKDSATAMFPIKYSLKNGIKIISVTTGNVLNIGGIIFNIYNPYNNLEVPMTWLANKGVDLGNGKIGIRTGTLHCTTKKNISTGMISKCSTVYDQTFKNNSSVVIKAILGRSKILLTGDAEFYAEELMLGKATSSSTNQLKITNNSSVKVGNSTIYNMNETYQVSLSRDIASNEHITQSNAIKKYKLDRLTPKIMHSQILKKGHHGYKTSTSVGFLSDVNASAIITTSGNYTNHGYYNVIPYLENISEDRIFQYFKKTKNIQITSNNWKSYIYAPARKTKNYSQSGITEVTTYGRGWDTSLR